MTVDRLSATRAAVAELRSIRSTDPCAALAITTVKATIHTLETRWLAGPPVGDVPPGPTSAR